MTCFSISVGQSNGTSFATAAQVIANLTAAPTPVPNSVCQHTPATAATNQSGPLGTDNLPEDIF